MSVTSSQTGLFPETVSQSSLPETGLPAAVRPITVCLLISSLEFGGAERQVVEMVRTFDRSRVQAIICSLSGKVPLAENLPDRSRDLRIIEKRGRFDFTTIFRVACLLRREKIEIVHAFLFDSEITARLAAPLAGVKRVISSERNTEYQRPLLHRAALKLTRRLFDRMVANSNSGKQFNIRTQGLKPSRIEVVHNGVDTKRFQPDPAAGHAFRDRLGIAQEVALVGMVGSFKRQKGHDNFLRTAAGVLAVLPDTRFLLVGGPVTTDGQAGLDFEQEIRRLAESLGVSSRCHFAGNQSDMKAVYNACTLTALLSRREGTPNVVLESMACGIPVVASDIADNALLIENERSGFIVPVDNPVAAAERIRSLLTSRTILLSMKAAARERMEREFSLSRVAEKLEAVYRSNALSNI